VVLVRRDQEEGAAEAGWTSAGTGIGNNPTRREVEISWRQGIPLGPVGPERQEVNRSLPDRGLVEVAFGPLGGVGHDERVSTSIAVSDLEGQSVSREEAMDRQFSDTEVRDRPSFPGRRGLAVSGEVDE
jgi:hypothetical protein